MPFAARAELLELFGVVGSGFVWAAFALGSGFTRELNLVIIERKFIELNLMTLIRSEKDVPGAHAYRSAAMATTALRIATLE